VPLRLGVVFCWLILGAIVNPTAFVPYLVAVSTLVSSVKAIGGAVQLESS
jgi:hypothetical protein